MPAVNPTAVPVRLVATPEVGVPRIGGTKVGLVDNTLLPEPVLVVTPVPPLATGNVPVTPVVNGKPVKFVATPEVGVPSKGVTSVGLVARTLLPLPVLVVTPVPPFATGKIPVTPVVRGRPVKFVAVPLVGVPNIGVTKVGLVDNTAFPLPVLVVTPVPPLATGSVPVTPVVSGKPVVFVSTPADGVPRLGVTSTGLFRFALSANAACAAVNPVSIRLNSDLMVADAATELLDGAPVES